MRLLDGSILYWNNKQDAYSKAECYREGLLVKQSMPRALVLYRQAARRGDARAYFRLGGYYQQNNQKIRAFSSFYEAAIRNEKNAISQLQKLSARDAEAALLLGKVYEYNKQYAQAISFYKKAHELNHPEGLYYVAKLFSHVSYSEKQGKEAIDFYRDSVKLGSKYALEELITLSTKSGKASFYLAQIYEIDLKQIDRGLHFYEKSNQLRYGEATFTLANIYAQGRNGVSVDIVKASRYYITALQQGHSSAISSLQSLAQRGHAEAQYILGYDYYRSKNDVLNAVNWCMKADIQGHKKAAEYLKGNFTGEQHWIIANYYLEHGVTQDDERWHYHFQKAADKGNAHVAFYLAQQSEGLDVSRHRSSILIHYNTAAQSGNGESEAATHRFDNALIYSTRNSGTLFASFNDANAGGTTPSLHSIQQKMKHK